jgi:hypothetical protein
MVVRDAIGNTIEVGSIVAVNVGSELGLGTVKKIESGLGLEGSAQSQPSIFIEIFMQRPVFPNGVVVGVLSVVNPKPQSTIAEV